ncbi:unnamed protein product [Peronospora farinosa]|uniref:PX domain-containing protein n=1 Tax=Peronospora farinosa TaxID=134698 RepID=A0AAV0UCB2_9STRA|nr:unnamed protein product [Peronospora farinosa]CAI5734641.1 unnamed protein product [Peronospora farinosa]
MRENLAASRMTLSLMNQSDPNERELRLWLLSANTQRGVTYYRIAGRFTSSGQSWEVSHRYSEFLKLRDQLVKFLSASTDKCPGCRNYLHSIQRFEFPKKHLFASRAPPVVNYRVKALRSFINLLASWAFSKTPKCPTCGGYAFDVVRDFVLDGCALSADADMNSIRESVTIQAFAKPNLSSSRGSKTPTWMTSSFENLDMTQSMDVPNERALSKLLDGPKLREAPVSRSSQREILREKQPAMVQEKATREMSHKQPSAEQQQRRRHQDIDPYDAFNDYLPERQSKVKKATQSSMEQKIQKGKFTSRPLHESIDERRQRYQQEEEKASAYQQKHRSEPCNLIARRSLAENELSVGSRVFESPHSSERVASQNSFSAESLISETEPIFVRGDELQRDGLSDDKREDRRSISSVYSGDDELELTGVTMVSPPHERIKSSVDNLWQPWELARVA